MTDRRSLVMANLRDTLRAVPSLRGAVAEAPSEDEMRFAGTIKRPLPWAWVYERGPTLDSRATGLVFEALPVSVEVAFEYTPGHDTEGCRAKGRRLLADVQAALAEDVGRGHDAQFNARIAQDTVEQTNEIFELPQMKIGVVALEYVVTFARAWDNPRSIVPRAA